MRKKSLVTMIVALALTASVMVGATLAYLTAQTGPVTNTFTIGNVKIELTEPSWDENNAQNLVPGVGVAKDPTVTNTGANDAYVVVTVEGMQKEKMACVGFDAVVNEGWVKVNADGTVDTTWDDENRPLVDGIYAYTALLAVGEKTVPLFNEVVYNGYSSSASLTIDLDEGKYVVKDVDGNLMPIVGYTEQEAKDYLNKSYSNSEGFTIVEMDEGMYAVKDASGNFVPIKFATEQEAINYLDSQYNKLPDGIVRPNSFNLVVQAHAIQTTGFDLVNDDGVYTWVAELGITN